jgi:hypothetical protein
MAVFSPAPGAPHAGGEDACRVVPFILAHQQLGQTQKYGSRPVAPSDRIGLSFKAIVRSRFVPTISSRATRASSVRSPAGSRAESGVPVPQWPQPPLGAGDRRQARHRRLKEERASDRRIASLLSVKSILEL